MPPFGIYTYVRNVEQIMWCNGATPRASLILRQGMQAAEILIFPISVWIKCIAEGQKVPGIDGKRTHNPLIQSHGLNPIYHGTSS